MAADITPLKISIFLPRKFGMVEQAVKYSQAIKNCPACAESLVLLVEKQKESGQEDIDETSQQNHPPNPPTNGGTSGWFCNNCGIHIMPGEETKMSDAIERILSSMKNEPSDVSRINKGDIPASPARKVLDDDYLNWESQLQSEFSEFLGGIRDHFSDKEVQLRKYQVDLCQRERQLKTSEESFRERMDKFKTNEHELHERIERLNEYKKTMLKQVSAQMKTLEFRCRASNGYRKAGVPTFEAWAQTDLAGVNNNIIRDRQEPDQLPPETDPPPPYSSNHDLTQRAVTQVPPLSVESGYLSRGSSLSPDSARNIWERYGKADGGAPHQQGLARVSGPGRLGRAYSPSRSVAVDEVHIRYGAQSPPEKDAPAMTSTPAKQEPAEPRPSARGVSRIPPPHRDSRNYSQSPTGRYQSFPHTGARGLSPNRSEGEREGEKIAETASQERLPPWRQDRGNSPHRAGEPTSTAPSIPRPERCLSPQGRDDREASPARAEPYGLVAKTNLSNNEIVLQYSRADGNRSTSPSKSSGIPVQRTNHRRPSNPVPWSSAPARGTSPDPNLRNAEDTNPSDTREVQVEVEQDETVPEKPRLQAVRSWDIIHNGLEIASAGTEATDDTEILSPTTTTSSLVPPSSGNLVPSDTPSTDEHLSKPVTDPRFFEFAPQLKSSGQASPSSDHSNQSSRKSGSNVLRKPHPLSSKTRLRLQEHRGSSASDADSRSSASNYVYSGPSVASNDEERGRPMSRMVKSGSNIGSYDAKQYSAHHRSTSAGRVPDEAGRYDRIDEGFYDVRGATSKSQSFTNGEELVEDKPPPERQTKLPRQLPVKPSTPHPPRPNGHAARIRDESPESHYVDMSGNNNERASRKSEGSPRTEKKEKTKAPKSQSPNRFTSKLNLFMRKDKDKDKEKKASPREPKEHGRSKSATAGVGKIKLDDKSTWAIKKRREETKKVPEPQAESQPPTTAITNGHEDPVTEKPKSKPFKRQPIPFSFGAGRRSLNSGVSSNRGRSPSPSPMRADHTLVSNTDGVEGSVVRQSSGRGSGHRRPLPEPAESNTRFIGSKSTNFDDNANDKTFPNENHDHGYSNNLSKSYSGPKRQITPPREYTSRIPRSASPTQGRPNYRQYPHNLSGGEAGVRQYNGTSTYDSEV